MIGFPIELHLPLTLPAGYMIDLADGLTSYEHSISDQAGFESVAISRDAPADLALTALVTWLGGKLVAAGPDADIIAEGLLTTIEATFGEESRSVSLDPMANRIRVKYTLAAGGGSGTTSAANDTASQVIYGVKETVQSFETTDATDAANKATRLLAELKNPRMDRRSRAGAGSRSKAAPGAQLRCTFSGYYATLDWLTTSSTSTTSTDTGTQVGSLITSYRATNANFVAASTIATTGRSAPETIADGTTYRRAIEDRLASGNSSGQPLAWGVYEGAVFLVANPSAATTPGTVTYRRYLGDGRIYNAAGCVVPWWQVRPNAIYEVVDLLDPGPISTAQDAAARSYVARVRFSVQRDGMSLDLEGSEGQSVDRLLARIR
jgi:hypothetical protein